VCVPVWTGWKQTASSRGATGIVAIPIKRADPRPDRRDLDLSLIYDDLVVAVR